MRDLRLKICDLCGAPNLLENTECHVCGWRGHFSTEPTKVRSVIEVARKLQYHHTKRRDHLLRRLWKRLVWTWTALQDWYRWRRGSYRSPF